MITVILQCEKCGKKTVGPEVGFEKEEVRPSGYQEYEVSGSVYAVCPSCGGEENVEC